MLENVELNKDKKKQLKVIAANYNITMKALIVEEATTIMKNNISVPESIREDETDRTSLIIDIKSSFKEDIKLFTYNNNLKIRDLWVFCVDRIIDRYTGNEV